MAIWSGRKDQGSREFTPAEERLVVRTLLRYVGRENATSMKAMEAATGLQGRTLRSIISAHDGIDYVVHSTEAVLYVCEFADETERTTRRMWATANRIKARALRREEKAKELPRRQYRLFDDDDDDSTDDSDDF